MAPGLLGAACGGGPGSLWRRSQAGAGHAALGRVAAWSECRYSFQTCHECSYHYFMQNTTEKTLYAEEVLDCVVTVYSKKLPAEEGSSSSTAACTMRCAAASPLCTFANGPHACQRKPSCVCQLPTRSTLPDRQTDRPSHPSRTAQCSRVLAYVAHLGQQIQPLCSSPRRANQL